MRDYDIAEAFERIENELLDSMMRNFKRHRAEETELGFNWSQWQAEQLSALEEYRRKNMDKFESRFSELNSKVGEMLRTAKNDGGAEQEKAILDAVQKGYSPPAKSDKPLSARFFKTNESKMDSLVKSTTDDLTKAEHAVLRRSNDIYRKTIFNAQVYANSGAGTYEKAVDMAVRDMAAAGLNCVEYKNGARHTLHDYADMALKTANRRAALMGEGDKRREWGETLVIVRHKGGCAKCARHIGHVYIDDIYSGGTKEDGDYPLLSDAVKDGLLHPRCRVELKTYFEGITKKKPVTDEELEQIGKREELTEKEQYYGNQAERNERVARCSLDADDKRIYSQRAEACREKQAEIRDEIKAHDNGEKTRKTVEKSGESGIIKSIDVDDYEIVTYGKNINPEVSNMIIDTMTKCEDENGFIISEISSSVNTNGVKGIPVLQIEPMPNGLLKLNINADFLSGKTIVEIDDVFFKSDISVVDSLKEAVIHESGHAISIKGKSPSEIAKLYDELADIHLEGVSSIALKDGAECLAELEVLRSRKIQVNDVLKAFYRKYMGKDY